MMGSRSELSLEYKPQSYSMLLKSFGGDLNSETNQPTSQKFQEYLNRLEEEHLKIDAFKRELPLCMQLLTRAMEASKQKLQSYKANNGDTRPVLEEFMPLKHPNFEGSNQKPTNISDKSNWMVTAQLWSSQEGEVNNKRQISTLLPKYESENGFISANSLGLVLDAKQRNGAHPDLGLASSDREIEDKCGENSENGMRSDNSSKGDNGRMNGKSSGSQATTTTTTTTATTTSQTHRKARRCWSPDLHRRFVNALQMLGGSKVATPKQIREIMKVDGLTNDEVKSHLQKYRLHTRRPSPSPQTTGAPAPQLVVLGGIWVPPEYATAAAAAHGGAPTIYSTHPSTTPQVSSHHCSPIGPPEFYPQQGHPQALHHAALQHHKLHVYKTTSRTHTRHSSPGSDAQGAGDLSESIEDGKSESDSWRGESGENNRLVALRDDGDVNNGSEISLKF